MERTLEEIRKEYYLKKIAFLEIQTQSLVGEFQLRKLATENMDKLVNKMPDFNGNKKRKVDDDPIEECNQIECL